MDLRAPAPDISPLAGDLAAGIHYLPDPSSAPQVVDPILQSVLDELAAIGTAVQHDVLDPAPHSDHNCAYEYSPSNAFKDYSFSLSNIPFSPLIASVSEIDPLTSQQDGYPPLPIRLAAPTFSDQSHLQHHDFEDNRFMDICEFQNRGIADDVATTITLKSLSATSSLDSMFNADVTETEAYASPDTVKSSITMHSKLLSLPDQKDTSMQDMNGSPVTPSTFARPQSPATNTVNPTTCDPTLPREPSCKESHHLTEVSVSLRTSHAASNAQDASHSASSISRTGENQKSCSEASSAQRAENVQVDDIPPRRYKIMQSSKFCHICVRSGELVSLAPCANVITGVCRKAICKKCFEKHGHGHEWDSATQNHALLAKEQAAVLSRGAVSSPRVRLPPTAWTCLHCRNLCPDSAQCKIYARTNKRRHMLLKQRKAEKARYSVKRLGGAALGGQHAAGNFISGSIVKSSPQSHPRYFPQGVLANNTSAPSTPVHSTSSSTASASGSFPVHQTVSKASAYGNTNLFNYITAGPQYSLGSMPASSNVNQHLNQNLEVPFHPHAIQQEHQHIALQHRRLNPDSRTQVSRRLFQF